MLRTILESFCGCCCFLHLFLFPFVVVHGCWSLNFYHCPFLTTLSRVKMHSFHVATLALLVVLLLATTINSFVLKPTALTRSRINKVYPTAGTHQHDRGSGWSSLRAGNNELDREMDTFLERASLSGSEKISTLTPEQRALRAMRGCEIEDQIFEIRDRLLQMEEDVFAGRNGVTIDQIKEARDLLAKLKEGTISFE